MNKAFAFARSAIFNVCFFSVTIILMIAGLPTLAANRHAVFGLARLWSRTSLWLLRVICGLKVEFRGLENIPDGGFILAAKHQSALETFALVLHVRDFSFILKRELTRIPLFGWYLKRAEQIAIDRASGRAAMEQAIERSRALLSEGRSVFIFPEGTRTAVGAAPKYKMGVANIYAATGAPCAPVALNTGVFWPRRSFIKYPGLVVIEFLPAIAPGMEKAAFLKLLQERIESATTNLVANSMSADRSVAARINGEGR
jgi:1-acyl-sn-glycerol-3-phosphate acyltransferase